MLLDKDIREPLFDFLEERYGKVRILEEKTVGNSRADVVMVIPDKIVGIEIKSDADTYTRLESQVADYDLYFDQNIVVVGSTHAGHVAEHVPDYWGIISVEEYDTGIKSDTDGKPDAEGLEDGVSDKLTHKIDFYVVREMICFVPYVYCGDRSLHIFRRPTAFRCIRERARISSGHL